MFLFVDFEHHLQIFAGDYIPNSCVMFNWDTYQPLLMYIFSMFQSIFQEVKSIELMKESNLLFLRWPYQKLEIVLISKSYPIHIHMGVSINGGTQKWLVYQGKHHLNG